MNVFKSILYIPFYNLLIFFAWLTGGSVGWAIILVTVVIRILLLPPSLKAAKATTKMQSLQPKMNALKEKYKGDNKKLNEETMRLYKEAGASPLGCCGPMLIQLVVIWILYRVFMIGFDTANYNLLYSFTPRPEALNNLFLGFDMSKPDLWILPILAGLTQFALSMMTLPKVDPKAKQDPAMAMNRQMAFLFPIMTIFIGRSLQSGLVLYWIITTIFSIGQQWYVNKNIKTKSQDGDSADDTKLSDGTDKQEINESVEQTTQETASREGVEGSKKKDMISNIMSKRLDKSDRKKGVEVTIRTKK
ncbi:MAG: Membrane protein insertase MisCA precursor [bacterium ADurb.Bin212]|nr:MAG: Membrane protein insertase MisCA precursor [bacterium ADurb.Bin212]